ncbi:hypothetical protein ACIA5E_18140 [Nocardia asteroides]|uniref:DUF6414 family protein n=1 Tax=Nocardia asteroides TaxID=1824 RepID=UPI0037B989D4
MSRFRDFLYLDDRTVESLLSGVEGGSYESVDEEWSHRGETRSGSTPNEQSASSSSQSTSQQKRRLMQNAEARFSRLWDAVKQDEDEAIIDSTILSNDWNDAVEGQFCTFTGPLAVPPLVSILVASSDILNLGRLLERFNMLPSGIEDMAQLEMMTAAKEVLNEEFPAVVDFGTDSPKIIILLETEWSRAKIDRYNGRTAIFGRIIGKIDRGSSYPLLKIPGTSGMPKMNRAQRRQADRAKSETRNEMEIQGPALLVRALAVYQ